MRRLLDSDVLSQPAKKAGNARVISWLEKHHDQCYTSSIVIAQLAFWVRTNRGRQRFALQKWLTDLIEAMHGRILGFNVSTAHVWAELQHQFQAAGKPIPIEDARLPCIDVCHIENTTNSLMQLTTEPAMRGRVMALRVGIALGGTPLGAPLVGWVANSCGPRWALGVGAVSGFAAALVGVAFLARQVQPDHRIKTDPKSASDA